MASPYFTPIQTKSADYSGIARGGQAMGAAYAKIGEALGVAASSYFEKKKVEGAARRAASSKEGDLMLLNAGMSQEDIDLLDGMQREKIITEAIKEAGGIQQFQKTQLMLEQNRLAREAHEQQMRVNIVQAEQAEKVAADQRDDETVVGYFNRLTKGEDGELVRANNLIGLPDAGRLSNAVFRMSQKHNMGFGMGNNISQFFAKYRSDPNYDPTDKTSWDNALNLYNAQTGATAQQALDNRKLGEQYLISPDKIRDTVTEVVNNDPSWTETAQKFKGAQLVRDLFKEQDLEYDENGNVRVAKITEPVSAELMRRYMAMMSNKGALSEKDVSAIQGGSSVKEGFFRVYNQLVGAPEDYSGSQISPQDATFIYNAAMAVGDHYGTQADSVVTNAFKTAGTQYDNVRMDRIIELSGYGQYLSKKSRDGLFADLQKAQSPDKQSPDKQSPDKSSPPVEPTNEQKIGHNNRLAGIKKLLEENKGDTGVVKNILAEKNPNLVKEDLDELIRQAKAIGAGNSGGFKLDTGGYAKSGEADKLRSDIRRDYEREKLLGGSDIPVVSHLAQIAATDYGVTAEVMQNAVFVLAADKGLNYAQLKRMSKKEVADLVKAAAKKTMPHALGNAQYAANKAKVSKEVIDKIAKNQMLSAEEKAKALRKATRKAVEEKFKQKTMAKGRRQATKNFAMKWLDPRKNTARKLGYVGVVLALNDVADLGKAMQGEFTKDQIDELINEHLATASEEEKPIILDLKKEMYKDADTRVERRDLANSVYSPASIEGSQYFKSVPQQLMEGFIRMRTPSSNESSSEPTKIAQNKNIKADERKRFETAAQKDPEFAKEVNRIMIPEITSANDAKGRYSRQAQDLRAAYARHIKRKNKLPKGVNHAMDFLYGK